MKKQFFFSSFLPRSTSFIGYARSPYDDATFRDHLRPYLESGGNAAGKSSKKGAGEATAAGAARGEGASTSTEAAAAAAEAAASKKKPSFSATSTGGKECVEAFLRQVSYVSGDYEGDEGWAKLGGAIAAAEAEAASKCSPSSSAAALSALKLEGGGEQQQHQQQHQHPRGRLIYLALPPNVYPLALRGVRAHCSHVGSGGGGGGNAQGGAPSSSTASPAAPAPPIPMSPLRVAAVGAYVGTIFLVAASIVVAALLLPHPAAVAWLALLVR